MDKQVKIACVGAAEIALDELTAFQGNLKELSKGNYIKLKKEILELGFSEPVSVWREETEHGHILHLLNGHQRVRTLREMRDREGFAVPKIPVSWVQADDIKQAKKKVLALTSQYGEITQQGLYEFMHEADLSMPDIIESFRFPEINMERFESGFFGSPDQKEAEGAREVDESSVSKLTHKCPRCGFEFDNGSAR